jgi:hypothetical protein
MDKLQEDGDLAQSLCETVRRNVDEELDIESKDAEETNKPGAACEQR